jgi:chromosome segregation ATPase
MALVSEIADVIRMLADVVRNTREIVDAVNDGRKFLASRHPEAQQEFSELLEQMQRTIEGLAEVTKVISRFRFVSDGSTVDRETAERELGRFNNYVIEQNNDITKLKNRIRELKADCEKVRDLRDKLDARTETRAWGSLFGLLGAKEQKRAQELHSSLSNFYADDQRMIDLFCQTLQLAENAITDVEKALGPPGMANPYNVPVAASILGTYAVLFDAPQKELHRLADVLSDARTALRP